MKSSSRLIFGVGINDAGYPVVVRKRTGGVNRRIWTCLIYQAWDGMLKRCYSERFHEKHPTYADCSVDPEWHSFSAFRSWALPHAWERMQLDKDILDHGNRVYGPDKCIVIPSQLNAFMSDAAGARGEWPIGVCWHNRDRKFISRCCNPFTGKHEVLGYFSCPDLAHEAWRKQKHRHALAYADMQTDPRIAQALRTRYLVSKEQL